MWLDGKVGSVVGVGEGVEVIYYCRSWVSWCSDGFGERYPASLGEVVD